MVRPRSELQELLEGLDEAVKKVYFQPPNALQMEYPCIVYEREGNHTLYSDNTPSQTHTRYTITVIDRNPDSAIPQKVAALPLSSFNRFFAGDNLNHDVYTLYF
jgi:hypothetical protein